MSDDESERDEGAPRASRPIELDANRTQELRLEDLDLTAAESSRSLLPESPSSSSSRLVPPPLPPPEPGPVPVSTSTAPQRSYVMLLAACVLVGVVFGIGVALWARRSAPVPAEQPSAASASAAAPSAAASSGASVIVVPTIDMADDDAGP